MRRSSLSTLFLTVFLDLLGFGLVVPFISSVARGMGASDLEATLTGAAYSLMQFLFVPIWGRLSDRVGRRPVLLWSIAATVVGHSLLGLSSNLTMLVAARLWSGVATANIAVAQAYIADVTPPEGRARGMGMIGMAFGLGFILGPFLGGELGTLRLLSYRGDAAALVAAGLSVVNLVSALRTLPESLPPEARGKHVRGAAPIDFRALRAALAERDVGLALGVCFLLIFCFAGMEQTFPLFTQDVFGMDIPATGRVLGLVGVVSAVVQGGLIGRLTRRFGEAMLVRAGALVQAGAFVLFALAPAVGGARLWALYGGAVLVAAGSGLSNPALSGYVSRRARGDVQGGALGTLQSASALARAVGPALGGWLYQTSGKSAPYEAAAVGVVLAALLAMGLKREAVAEPVPAAT